MDCSIGLHDRSNRTRARGPKRRPRPRTCTATPDQSCLRVARHPKSEHPTPMASMVGSYRWQRGPRLHGGPSTQRRPRGNPFPARCSRWSGSSRSSSTPTVTRLRRPVLHPGPRSSIRAKRSTADRSDRPGGVRRPHYVQQRAPRGGCCRSGMDGGDSGSHPSRNRPSPVGKERPRPNACPKGGRTTSTRPWWFRAARVHHRSVPANPVRRCVECGTILSRYNSSARYCFAHEPPSYYQRTPSRWASVPPVSGDLVQATRR